MGGRLKGVDALLNSILYGISYFIKPFINIGIQEPNRYNTILSKISIAVLIILLLVLVKMTAAIQFYDQFGLGTVEIRDIRANWLLAAKTDGIATKIFVP